MAMNLDALLRIKADVQGENNIRRLGNSLQGLQGQAKNAALGFNNLKGAVAGFGAAIAGSAIVAGLGAIVKKSIDAGDELFNLQAKTGVAASALIGIGNAAKLADVDVGTLGKGITKLNINLVKAAEGNEDLARKFQALGVDVKDANGQVVPADKALKQIADRFADMPDGAQKAAAAVALFGKAGADLIPLLNEGAASMEKFTYKVGEDFAARSDKFNDTITELGIKTQGFGLELTDALLPALQSILEVFSDLFDSKQDFTELFAVIKFGIRIVASAIFVTIKLIDVLIKNTVTAFEAISKALQGDFAGAADIFKNRIGNFVEQAKQDFAQLGKIFTDAPSPGTGRRPGGRPLALNTDTSAADTAAAAAAKKRASEQERAAQRYNDGLKGAIDLAGDLNKQIRDIKLTTESVGASPVQKISNELQASLNAIQDEQETLFKKADEFTNKTGIQFEGLRNKIKALGAAKVELANETYQQDFAELYASQGEAIDKATESVYENARALQYNNDIMGGLKDGLSGYIEQIGTMRDALSSLGQQAFKGIEDALVSLVTTGTANFREFAVSILQETSRMIIQQLVLKSIMQAIGAIGGGGGGFLAGGGGGFTQFNASGVDFNPAAFSGVSFANGGIMTGDGPLPLNKYASGGIANSPQLAMFGEGRRPEAYVPLPDGRRIPVAMQGGDGGSTTVNVSVDAKGTSVQGNSNQGEQLGRAISQAVQAELIKQRRPGGILAMT